MKYLKTLKILTILLAVSLTVVSVAGGFLPGTYERDHPSMAAQGAGQDLVDLFLVVPLLLVSLGLTARGSRTARLVYGGTLFYILYSFVIYCFGVHFNSWFLLYCATMGLSLYAFILWMISAAGEEIESWFEGAPVKGISIYMLFVALVFYILWLRSIVPAILRNEVPADVAGYDLLVSPVHVIDLVFALPGMIIGAVLLWRKERMGYIIASLALVFMILLTIALAAMTVMVVLREINEDFTVAAVFGVLTITSVLLLILLFRKIKPGEGRSEQLSL